MQNKVKNIIVTVLFALFIAFFTVMAVICGFFNPVKTSEAERRPLAQFPSDISWDSIKDKTAIEGFEDFSVDQFPFREFFRGIKARFQMNVLGLKENNGLAVEDGYIVKVESGFNDEFVSYSTEILAHIYEQYFKDSKGNAFLSIIPDKNYYFSKDYGYASPDYEKLVSDVREALKDTEYIDLFDSLELADYYKTDTHWNQPEILGALEKLAIGLGVSEYLSGEYNTVTIDGDFYGVYHGQSALNPTPDKITYLTNEFISGAKLYNYGAKITEVPMYNEALFSGEDGYNVFLSGAAGNPVMRIVNNKCENKDTLIVFRDSYGSSILPLLSEAYRTIYVIDIRSVNYNVTTGWNGLYEYIPAHVFDEADVLFLYSTLVFNSNSFKPIVK
ncbi:MAG: hypothetical protein E7606_05860 [Ruminococcaceae bacterium]|nr:hypothetical protein [Oscillospiraceae bacterium]